MMMMELEDVNKVLTTEQLMEIIKRAEEAFVLLLFSAQQIFKLLKSASPSSSSSTSASNPSANSNTTTSVASTAQENLKKLQDGYLLHFRSLQQLISEIEHNLVLSLSSIHTHLLYSPDRPY
eukprot:TRINITY_DN3163_c0_g1_i1.p1 TRINITY_DN3163_c0_g1~~TRINITY_DN3163_c0_g1_i1.p1  ORF type:complete len:122 (+),score=30.38 TRINITY_DN3163_c0_g1_i1:79-444(+)